MEAGIAKGNKNEAINAIRMIFPDIGCYKNESGKNSGKVVIAGRNIKELKKILEVLNRIEISISDENANKAMLEIKGGD